MKSKLNNKSGSAMVLALILLFIVSISIVMFSNQISNSMRVTNKNYYDLKDKYVLEAGIESGIARMCDSMMKEYVNFKSNNFGIVLNEGDKIIMGKPSNENITPSTITKNVGVKIESTEHDLGYEVEANNTIRLNKYTQELVNNNRTEKIHYIWNDTNGSDVEITSRYNSEKVMVSTVKFDIVNLNTGNTAYSIKSWN